MQMPPLQPQQQLLLQEARFELYRAGQSHSAGTMGATGGNFRHSATSYGISVRSLGRQQRRLVQTAGRSLLGQRHATGTCCTTNARRKISRTSKISRVNKISRTNKTNRVSKTRLMGLRALGRRRHKTANPRSLPTPGNGNT